MKRDLLSHIDQIPPVIARFCGRDSGRPIALTAIASKSGMSLQKVTWIANQVTWSDITIGDAKRFADACGLDLLRPRRKLFYLKRATKKGLRTLGGDLPLSYVVKKFNALDATRKQRSGR